MAPAKLESQPWRAGMWRRTGRYPPKELRIALFESAPIEPRHDVPEHIGSGGFNSEVSDCDRLFFDHFDLFARAINSIYTPSGSWEGGPWRLQEVADTLIRLSGVDDYPDHGRRYEVFYNQACLGLVEINADVVSYTAENPTVFTTVALEHARLLPFDDVCDSSSLSLQKFRPVARTNMPKLSLASTAR